MTKKYYKYSVKEKLIERFGDNPFIEMKKRETDRYEKTDRNDLDVLCWAKAYLGALGRFIQFEQRFLLDSIATDDYIALISDDNNIKTVYMLFMLVERRDTFSPEPGYLDELIEEWRNKGYAVKFMIDIVSVSNYDKDKGGFHLYEKSYPVIKGTINGKECLRFEYSTYWDNCLSRLQYVLKNGDRTSYECTFEEDVEVVTGEYAKRVLQGCEIDYVMDLFSRYETITVGHVEDRNIGAYYTSVFADNKELSVSLGRNNLLSQIKILDRKNNYIPEESTFKLSDPVGRIPHLSGAIVLDPIKMYGYALQLQYGQETRNYYLGWFKGPKSPDDVMKDGFLFTPENINDFTITEEGSIEFANGYVIPKHILYYRSCRQLEIEKTGYVIAESDGFKIKSLYRTPLLRFCGHSCFTQHWGNPEEYYGPAKALIDDDGNRVTPVELFDIRDESLNDDCLNACTYPNDKRGILNKDGNWLFPPIYENIQYSDDVYLAEIDDESDNPYNTCACGIREENGEKKSFLLTADGNEKELDFDYDVKKFSSGLCPFSVKGWKGECPREGYYWYDDYEYEPGLWGFFDKKGDVVIEPRYILQFGFWNAGGKHCVVAKLIDGELKWGVIDLEGNEVVPCSYAELYCRWGEAVAFKREKDGLYGLMDFEGNVIVEPMFGYIEQYEKDRGLITAGSDDDHLGVYSIDQGKFIIECDYDDVEYEDDYIECELSYTADCHYYSYDCRRIETPEKAKYHHEPECRNGLRAIEDRKLKGLETLSGDRILDVKYQWMTFKDDVVYGRETNGNGWSIRDVLVDYKGRILIDGEYRSMWFTKDKQYITAETPNGREIFKIIKDE